MSAIITAFLYLGVFAAGFYMQRWINRHWLKGDDES